MKLLLIDAEREIGQYRAGKDGKCRCLHSYIIHLLERGSDEFTFRHHDNVPADADFNSVGVRMRVKKQQ